MRRRWKMEWLQAKIIMVVQYKPWDEPLFNFFYIDPRNWNRSFWHCGGWKCKVQKSKNNSNSRNINSEMRQIKKSDNKAIYWIKQLRLPSNIAEFISVQMTTMTPPICWQSSLWVHAVSSFRCFGLSWKRQRGEVTLGVKTLPRNWPTFACVNGFLQLIQQDLSGHRCTECAKNFAICIAQKLAQKFGKCICYLIKLIGGQWAGGKINNERHTAKDFGQKLIFMSKIRWTVLIR